MSMLARTVLLQCLFLINGLNSLSTVQRHRNRNAVTLDFHGLMPAVFTPINDDQSVNLDLIPEYAQYIADNGFKGVLVGGTTGEGVALSVEERKSLNEAWVEAGRPLGLHIQTQVGGAPLPDVIALAKHAESIGVDSILTLPELYYKPKTVEELVSYVELVADAVPNTPVLYYHNPGHSEVKVNMAQFASAASSRIPNFKGLKFTSTDLKEAAQTLRTLKDDQEIFLGADALIAPAALLGIRSVIGSGFNLFPELTKDIVEAVQDSDIPKARKLQERMSVALEAIGDGKPALKAAMEVVTGMKIGPPKLPNKPISEDVRKRMANDLRSMGFDIRSS